MSTGKKSTTENEIVFLVFSFLPVRNGLRVVFHHKIKYEKCDISKYEIPKTKYEALRISSKLVLQFFLGGEKNLVFRNLVFFVYIFCDGIRPLVSRLPSDAPVHHSMHRCIKTFLPYTGQVISMLTVLKTPMHSPVNTVWSQILQSNN